MCAPCTSVGGGESGVAREDGGGASPAWGGERVGDYSLVLGILLVPEYSRDTAVILWWPTRSLHIHRASGCPQGRKASR